jgi:hypothetical protein
MDIYESNKKAEFEVFCDPSKKADLLKCWLRLVLN